MPEIMAPAISNQRCGTCKFHKPGEGGTLYCRRLPPTPVAFQEIYGGVEPGTIVATIGGQQKQMPTGGLKLMHVHFHTVSPQTAETFWCGEWKQRFLSADGTSQL